QVHDSLPQALQATGSAPQRRFAFTTKAQRHWAGQAFEPGDALVFGQETAGLSAEDLACFTPAQLLRLPMRPGQRSLNLSNAVAVAVFEAWRQQGYDGGV